MRAGTVFLELIGKNGKTMGEVGGNVCGLLRELSS